MLADSSVVYPDEYLATEFSPAVGNEKSKGYYNAQNFGKNNHLGEDWNAVTGGNTDLGDPIYAIANGYVKFASNIKGGWGNVVRINHKLPNGDLVESLYAHCDSITVVQNTWVKKGTQVGTIGTAFGKYVAHLHLEIRDNINLPIGHGYSKNKEGYLNPSDFIKKH